MSRLEEFKKYPSSIPNTMLLEYCPYYFEIEEYLKGIQLPTKEEVIQFVSEHFRESELYQSIPINEKIAKGRNLEFEILNHAKFRYDQLVPLVQKSVERSITLCELIAYLVNYPTTYPVPREEEKNQELESFLEEYDIMIQYPLGDSEYLSIASDDLVRLIETLDQNLKVIRQYLAEFATRQIFMRKKYDAEESQFITSNLGTALEMPLSSFQQKGQSRREIGYQYLKR